MSWITIDAVDKQGQAHEVLVEQAAAPAAGQWFSDGGRRLRRVPSSPRCRVKWYEGLAYSMPRKKHAEKYGFAMFDEYTPQGVGIIKSRKSVTEYTARHNDNPQNGTQVAFDPDGND
jgi:hypothetical protein